MYRYILGLTLLLATLNASVFEKDCISCHEELDVGLDKFFYRYVLTFSSQNAVKAALKDYLLNHMKEKSILPEGLLLKYGVKEPTTLSEKELEIAIDEYWDRYTFIGKIK